MSPWLRSVRASRLIRRSPHCRANPASASRSLWPASILRRTSRCLIVHEDTITAGFGAEIAAVVAKEAFWYLDAPVDRLAVADVPMPYHPTLLEAILPDADRIAERIEALLAT